MCETSRRPQESLGGSTMYQTRAKRRSVKGADSWKDRLIKAEYELLVYKNKLGYYRICSVSGKFKQEEL